MPTVCRLGGGSRGPTIRDPRRGSPRERGYTARWDRYSLNYRRRLPFCVECERRGVLTFAEVVDHKLPVADGGEVFPGDEGLWGLCDDHHAWKAALERYARETGQMDQIVMWCDRPETRPRVGNEAPR